MQAADFTSFRTRAAQQQRALEAQVADARQDRSAAVAVIEGLQRELREARCECAALVDQRRYFEERALATSAATQQNLPSDSTYAAHASGPDAATEGAQVCTVFFSFRVSLAPIPVTSLLYFAVFENPCSTAGSRRTRASTGSYHG